MKEPVFFKFRSRMVSSTLQAGAPELKRDVDGEDKVWNLIKGKYEGIDFPVVFKQYDGKNLTDLLDTGWSSRHLISDRMKNILEENHLTGWKTFPIKLYDKKGNEILGYHGFSVTGRCAPIDYEKSEIIEKRLVPTGTLCKYYKGQHIDIDKCDGSDFFAPDDVYSVFVTEKAAIALKKYKITNLDLKNSLDAEIDVTIIKKKR